MSSAPSAHSNAGNPKASLDSPPKRHGSTVVVIGLTHSDPPPSLWGKLHFQEAFEELWGQCPIVLLCLPTCGVWWAVQWPGAGCSELPLFMLSQKWQTNAGADGCRTIGAAALLEAKGRGGGGAARHLQST